MDLQTQEQEVKTQEWSEGELVEFYIEKRGIEMRKVLDYLADRLGRPVSGAELAKHLGVSGEQFRGVMRGAERSRRPFETQWDSETNQTLYILPKRAARILRSTRLILEVVTRLRLSISV